MGILQILLYCGSLAFSILMIVLFVKLIQKISKNRKLKHSRCPKCNTYYFKDDISIEIGDLKWERCTKTEWKGDIEYEITYKQFYRLVAFDCTCPKCGHVNSFVKRFNLYTSDSKYSQSYEEEMQYLNHQITNYFDPCVFDKELYEKQTALKKK